MPLLISIPGTPATSVDTIVSLVDLLPTLANRLGLPSRIQWEGRDMFASRDPAGPVYANAKYNLDWQLNLQSMRFGDMKLIRKYSAEITELYDLSSDPGELVNLAESQPSTCRMLTTMLHQHLLDNARSNGADSAIIHFPDIAVEEGTVYLTAPAGTGHIWFKNGTPLLNDMEYIRGVNSQTLIISDLMHFDSAAYECMYNDDTFRLNVTSPYNMNVVSSEAVPAYSSACLFLLALIIIKFSLSSLIYSSDVTHQQDI